MTVGALKRRDALPAQRGADSQTCTMRENRCASAMQLADHDPRAGPRCSWMRHVGGGPLEGPGSGLLQGAEGSGTRFGRTRRIPPLMNGQEDRHADDTQCDHGERVDRK